MDRLSRIFLQHLEEKEGCSENTILAYRADLQQFMSVLSAGVKAPTSLELITSESLSAYVTWLMQQGYRPATISRKIAAVRSFLNYLHLVEGVDNTHLVDELQAPPAPRREPRMLSSEETKALLEAPARVDNPRALRDFAILSLLVATGLRAAEAVNLDLDDVDLLQETVFRPPSRDFSVPLGTAAQPLRRYLREGRPFLERSQQEQAFFLNQRGERLSRQGLWLVVKRWAKAADLGGKISPQTLRHTLARNLMDQGKSRKEVQQILGLSSPNVVWMRHRPLPEQELE
jgi:integrase/recombinase XerD